MRPKEVERSIAPCTMTTRRPVACSGPDRTTWSPGGPSITVDRGISEPRPSRRDGGGGSARGHPTGRRRSRRNPRRCRTGCHLGSAGDGAAADPPRPADPRRRRRRAGGPAAQPGRGGAGRGAGRLARAPRRRHALQQPAPTGSRDGCAARRRARPRRRRRRGRRGVRRPPPRVHPDRGAAGRPGPLEAGGRRVDLDRGERPAPGVPPAGGRRHRGDRAATSLAARGDRLPRRRDQRLPVPRDRAPRRDLLRACLHERQPGGGGRRATPDGQRQRDATPGRPDRAVRRPR